MRFGSLLISVVVLFSAVTCRTADTDGVSAASMEQLIFQLVNEYRHASGLSQLEWNETVTEAARQHSRDMAAGTVPFGHDGFSQRVSSLSAQLSMSSISENVGMTANLDSPARAIVDAWTNSAAHLENLRGSFHLTGVGAAQGEGSDTWYFTQIYVELRP